MTVVNLDIRKLTQLGSEAATATVVIEFVQGGASPVLVNGPMVAFPERVELTVTGAIALDIPATGVVMAAHWSIVVSGGIRLERWTLIPDAGPSDFGALQDVDPATLQPTTTVIQAWQNTIDQATAAKTAAETARTGAEVAQAAAVDAANLALAGQFAGATVNAPTDVDTFRTPGVYRFTGAATTSPNLPTQLSGVLTVTRVNGDTNVMQEYRPFSGTAVRRRGYYMRTAANSATAFDAWDFVSPVRFDTTAGRAAYIVDSVAQREQRIYGDTGWRDVTSLLDSAKWDYASSNFHVLMRRVGDNVQMVARLKTVGAVAAGDTFLTAPTGFRGPVPAPGAAPFSVGPVAAPTGVGHIRTAPFSVTGVLDFRSAIAATTEISFALSWLTTEAWPTALPGAASGTIPNL